VQELSTPALEHVLVPLIMMTLSHDSDNDHLQATFDLRAAVQVSLSNDSITLVASNAPSTDTRLALKQLHVQLLDIHGNFTSPGCRSDCRVRFICNAPHNRQSAQKEHSI
jgi:hypothetical protein